MRDLVRETYAVGGRPSIDPIVFFKLQLVLFFEGIRSERELVRLASALFEHGVLTLTLPKTAKERARRIPVRGQVEQLAQRELEQERSRRELDSR